MEDDGNKKKTDMEKGINHVCLGESERNERESISSL